MEQPVAKRTRLQKKKYGFNINKMGAYLLGKVFGFLTVTERFLQVALVCQDWQSNAYAEWPSLYIPDDLVLNYCFDVVLASQLSALEIGYGVTDLEIYGYVSSFPITSITTRVFLPMFLSEMHHLLELELEVEITDDDLLEISVLPCLETLTISDCTQLTDTSIDNLFFNLESTLHSLTLVHNALFTPEGLHTLSYLSNLRYLALIGLKAVDDEVLSSFSCMFDLKGLYISTNDRITDVGLLELSGLTDLNELSLSFCPHISMEGITKAFRLKHLYGLQLAGFAQKKEDDFLRLAKTIMGDTLTTLDISHSDGVSDDDLQVITRGFKMLQYLDVQECPNITREGLERLRPWQKTRIGISRCKGVVPAEDFFICE